ncbi:MAG: hypothetical protein Q9M15_02910 [Mariprofundaceae bacterium]|nr:hypothetical protein [Mariprofundaceae bacterium]
MDEKQTIDLIAQNIAPLLHALLWLIGIVLTIFAATMVWAWKMSAIFTNITNDISSLKTSVEKLVFRVDTIDRKLDHMDAQLVKLDVHFPDAPNYQALSVYTQANSPLTLTEEGERMLSDSGFYKVLEENKGIFDGIIANAETRIDQEAFVEKAAFEKIEAMFNEDNVIVAPVAQFMYEQGMRQSEQVYNGATRAFGVAARDAIFLRMGINPPIAKQHQ